MRHYTLAELKHLTCKLLSYGEHGCAASYAVVEITNHGYLAVTIASGVLIGGVTLVAISHFAELILVRFL